MVNVIGPCPGLGSVGRNDIFEYFNLKILLPGLKNHFLVVQTIGQKLMSCKNVILGINLLLCSNAL